ncbi:MAG: PQQ-binding-like beta-propeller repeat protein [Chloroflexota bacterium]
MKRSSVVRKVYAIALTLLLVVAAMTLLSPWSDVARASTLAYFTQTTESGAVGTVNAVYGTVASGNSDSLRTKNQGYLVMSSASNGTSQETSFWSEITLGSADTYIMSLEVDVTTKASVSNSTEKVYLYNYDTSAYDEVKSSTIGTSDTNVVYSCEVNSTIAKYVSDSKALKIKIVVTNASSFDASFDYVNVIYEYQPQVGSRAVSTYNVGNATVEYGTVSANDPTYLRQRDGSYYTVASSNNKVAWHSRVTMSQPRSEIKTLMIAYSGKYSTSANNSWLSLWNYETGNWQVVYNFASNTTTQTVRWLTSDSTFIDRFVSEFNDVKIRLYNSGSGAFTRYADYLNVTIYYDTSNSVKSFSPDTLTMEYGTIASGSVSSLSAFDNSALVANSNASNKIAWQAQTTIDVDRQYVKSLTVIGRTKTSTASTNPQYFSLYNYSAGNFVVFRTQTTSTSNENLIFTMTDPVELYRYISSSGAIKARLYNSASTAFTRTTDVLTFVVEYGTVGTFEFAHLSDVHELIGSDNFKAIIDELNNTITPAFTVVTGDVTDHGTPLQYDQYITDSALISGTVYTGVGNHDVRWWNSNGKNDFKNKIGELYYSFDYGGVHFVMLDSSVVLELDEKFGKAQFQWLANDLDSVSADKPVIIFAHHPFKIHNNVTGKAELLDVISDNNVAAFVAGHQHYWGHTIENGVLWEYITCIKDTQEYSTIKVTPNKLYIYKRNASDHSSVLWLTAPMENARKASMTTITATAQTDGDVDVSVVISKAPDGVSTVQARVDNYGSWTSLTESGNTWSGTISISGYSPSIPYGKHFVGVNMTDDVGKVWKEYKEYEWSGGDVTTKWVFQTGDIIQSSPTYFDGVVYVGSEDGKLYAINDSNGTLKWSYTTGDQIISKPAVYEGATKDLVIIGSHDKKIYALNASTGALEWYYLTGGSVISDPLVDNGVVYFGSGDKYIYALDASDGTFKWKYQTGGLMRQRPIVHNGKLYVFVRDTYIWYALNTSDGSLYWRGNAGTDESMFVCGDVRPVITGTAASKLWCIDAQNTKAGYLDPVDGSLDWTSTVTQISSRGPATDGTRVFYPSGGGREIYAFNASDNSQAWYKDLRAGGSDSDLQEFQIDSALIYDGGVLYHVAERGRITGLDPANGNIKFVYDAVGYPERVLWSTPEVYNKTIYVGGLDGKLYAIKNEVT